MRKGEGKQERGRQKENDVGRRREGERVRERERRGGER